MARRDFRQFGPADGIVQRRGKKTAWLERLDAAIDWAAVETIVEGIHASREGGPAYPLLTYVKLLLLQQWYRLSDEGSGIVREAVMTPADVHDSVPADDPVQGDEGAVYADKAYDGEARRAGLRERRIEPRIMYQARRNRPLKAWQTWFNKAVAPVRAGVERLFGTMKRAYGYRRVRYLGLARNEVQLQALCDAIDLRRALALGLA